MKIEMPGRELLLLILVFATVNPLNYAIMQATEPEGKVFLGYIDDAFQLALMKSVHFGFRSPWDSDQWVFDNPELGASETFAIIGTVPALLNLNLMLTLLAFKFVLSVAYLIIVYNLMKRLISEDKLKTAFLIFLFSSGMGWILYGASYTLFGPQQASVVGFAFTNEFEELGGGAHALSHLTRVYWLLPEITGLLSLLFLLGGRKFISGIFLGLTILFYPTFAVGFGIIILSYLIMQSYKDRTSPDFVKNFAKKMAKNLVPVIAGSFIFALYWAYKIIVKINLATTVYAKSWFSGLAPLTLAITFGITLSLAAYGFVKSVDSVLRKKIFLAALLVLGILSSLMQLYALSGDSRLLESWLKSNGFYGIGQDLFRFSYVIDALLLAALAYLFFDTLKKNIGHEYKFILLWIIAVAAVTVITPYQAGGLPFVFWWGARLRWFLLIPLSMAAALGIDYLKNKRIFGVQITQKLIIAAIILVSLPSLIGFNFYMQQVAHSSNIVYVHDEDYRAMKFLQSLENGRVLSSPEIGVNLPYFTGKTALLYNRKYREAVKDDPARDYEKFYSLDAPDGERKGILEKNYVKYVFYGKNEKLESGAGLNLENSPYLEKIYDNGTQIFRVLYSKPTK